jgi:predicted MFS family arabinose efflux permease
MAGMVLLAGGGAVSFFAGVMVVSIARGIIQALVASLTGDLVAQAQRGRAIGILHTAGDLGSAIGPSAAYLFLPWIGLRGAYLLCAGLFAAALILMLRLPNRQRT